MSMIIVKDSSGRTVAADPAEAAAYGWKPVNAPSSKSSVASSGGSVLSSLSPEELILATKQGGFQTDNVRVDVYTPSKTAIVDSKESKVITPKLAEGTSGWYVKQNDLLVPISAGVAGLLNKKPEVQFENRTVIKQDLIVTPVAQPKKYDYEKMPQLNVTAAYDYKGVMKELEISPENIGWEKFEQVERLMESFGFQTAQLGETIVSGKGMFTVLGAVPEIIRGRGKEYQSYITDEWLKKQRVEAYQITEGYSLVPQKIGEVAIPAALWILPGVSGAIANKALTSGLIGLGTATKIAKAGVVLTTGAFAYSTYEAVGGLFEDTPAGSLKFGTSAVFAGLSAYGLKKSWEASFPKQYKISSVSEPKVEYQTYVGEEQSIKGNYPSYEIKDSILYGDPAKEIPKNLLKPDKAIFAEIKGVRNVKLYTGENVQQEFTKLVKFRISEQEGLYKPLKEVIGETDIFFPKGTGATELYLGTSYEGTNIGMPDVYNPFTFEKSGFIQNLNTLEWEMKYETIAKDIPIASKLLKGTGYETFKENFRDLMKGMIPEKDIVITSAKYRTFFVEPEGKMNVDFYKPSGKAASAWIEPKAPISKTNLFDMLGIRDVSGLGANIDTGTGKIITDASILGKSLKISPQYLSYSITDYDKPISVMVYAPADISSPIITPISLGSASSVGKVLKADTALGAFLGTGNKIETRTIYEPKVDINNMLGTRQLPRIMQQPKMDVAPMMDAQPKVDMMLEPKTSLMLHPKLMTRLQAKPLFKYDYTSAFKFDMVFPDIKEKIAIPKYKVSMFGKAKSSKQRKDKWVLIPKADPLSIKETEWMLGEKATNPKSTKASRKRFYKEMIKEPSGWLAGRFPTQQMIKRFKIKL